MVEEIQFIGIEYLENKIQKAQKPEHLYGFLLNIGKNQNGVKIDIRFELLVPINDSEYIFSKTISTFFLHHFDFDYLRNESETVSELVLISMSHTRMYLLSKFSRYSSVKHKIFKAHHFIPEIKRQMNIP